jgi:hypothetical protein
MEIALISPISIKGDAGFAETKLFANLFSLLGEQDLAEMENLERAREARRQAALERSVQLATLDPALLPILSPQLQDLENSIRELDGNRTRRLPGALRLRGV